MKKIQLVLILLILTAFSASLLTPTQPASGDSITSEGLLEKINEERKNRNIPLLLTDGRLGVAAGQKSSDMLERDYFDHVDPDGNYVWPLISNAGYKPYALLGENLAIDFNSESGIVKAWLNSPSHRDNLLNSNFADQGLSAKYGDFNGRYTAVVTSLFGRLVSYTKPEPASEPPLPATQPETPSSPTPVQPTTQTQAQNTPETEPSSIQAHNPAVLLEPSQVAELPGGAPLRFQIVEPTEIGSPEVNILQTVRLIFILLVLLLIFTVIFDLILHRNNKNTWPANPMFPIVFMLILTAFLTYNIY